MAEVVNIASLTIDVDDVIKESIRLKKEMNSLKESQDELKESGEETSEQYVEQEAQLKKLNKSYRDNQKFVESLNSANEDLTRTLQVEGKSVQQLRDDRATLNQISKQIVGDTEEEIALRDQLNTVINEQTEQLKKQAPEYIQNKENIGGYTEGINAADFNLRSLIVNSEEAGGATNLLSGGIKSGTKALVGFTKSALAFIATPVGIVLAAIAGAFLLIKNAMNRNEEAVTKVKRAFSAFTGIAKGLLKFLQPLGDFLIDGLVKGFELVEKGLFKVIRGIQKGLEFIGLDEAANSLEEFTTGVEESVKQSKALTEAELELAKAQRIARKVQLDYQKDAEKLRQIRDDESKSIAERQRANTALGLLLAKQGKEELEIANKAVEVARLRIQLDGKTAEALDAEAEALTEIADIQERITGQESEQLVNRVSLAKEAAELAEVEAERASDLARRQVAEFIEFEQQKLEVRTATNDALIEEEQRKFQAFGDAKQLQAAIDLENSLQLLEAESLAVYEIEAKRLEQQRQLELSEANKTGASVLLINEKYAARQKNLERGVTEAKIAGFGQVFSAYAEILGEQTAVGKAAAVASTLIQTYLGAQNAYTSLASIPIVGVGLGIAAAAAAVVAGLGNVRKIVSTPTEFASGDILQGKSHANGGIPFSIGGRLGFEAEGGEALINKKSTSMFAPLLSAINVAGGGKKFASGDILGGSGIPSTSLIDYDLIASKIAQANESIPSPVVSVSEIEEVASGVRVVEGLASA